MTEMKYLYLSQNRNEILERFQEKYNIHIKDTRKLSESLNLIDSTIDMSCESNNSN